jgi:hypothetical protein
MMPLQPVIKDSTHRQKKRELIFLFTKHVHFFYNLVSASWKMIGMHVHIFYKIVCTNLFTFVWSINLYLIVKRSLGFNSLMMPILLLCRYLKARDLLSQPLNTLWFDTHWRIDNYSISWIWNCAMVGEGREREHFERLEAGAGLWGRSFTVAWGCSRYPRFLFSSGVNRVNLAAHVTVFLLPRRGVSNRPRPAACAWSMRCG